MISSLPALYARRPATVSLFEGESPGFLDSRAKTLIDQRVGSPRAVDGLGRSPRGVSRAWTRPRKQRF